MVGPVLGADELPSLHLMKSALLPLLLLAAALGSAQAPAARADGLGDIVKAVCLSAFENEMSQSGKVAPAGMASYACTCVEQRIRTGSGIESARSLCRQATAERFPI
jgi:hypothetical protein